MDTFTHETNENTELLHPCPVIAADELLEIRAAVISSVSSLDQHFSEINVHVSRNVIVGVLLPYLALP